MQSKSVASLAAQTDCSHVNNTWCMQCHVRQARPSFAQKGSRIQTQSDKSAKHESMQVPYLVDFFHLGRLVSGTLNFLKWWKIVVITQSFVVIVDAQTKLNHSMNAACKLCRLVQVEARREQGGVEKQPDQIFHCFV